ASSIATRQCHLDRMRIRMSHEQDDCRIPPPFWCSDFHERECDQWTQSPYLCEDTPVEAPPVDLFGEVGHDEEENDEEGGRGDRQEIGLEGVESHRSEGECVIGTHWRSWGAPSETDKVYRPYDNCFISIK